MKTKFGKLNLLTLEDRVVPASLYQVQLDSPSQGVPGESALTITDGGLHSAGEVTASSSIDAILQALGGSVRVGEQTYELTPATISTNPADQRPFLLVETPQGYEVRLEDLAATPDVSDWDYNDTTWNTSVSMSLMNLSNPKIKPSGGASDIPVPEGATKIGGPGRIQYPPKSIAIVTDNTVEGDADAIRRVGPSDIRVVDKVGGGWPEVRRELGKNPAGTVGALIISGHGLGGGVAAANPENNLVPRTIDQATVDMIKSRLAPGAPIIIVGCQCGRSSAQLQALANATGHPVIANTGDMSDGNNGNGDWVRYDPQP